jgi:hypothetical protein
MTNLDDDMFEFLGRYDLPEKEGLPCQLTIELSFTNADNDGFAFNYGSESEGPPQEIEQFDTAAA